MPIPYSVENIQLRRNILQSCNAPTCKTEGKGGFRMANKRGAEGEHNLDEVNGKRSKTDVVELESDNSQYDDTGDAEDGQDNEDDDDLTNNVEDEDDYGLHTIFDTLFYLISL